MFTKIAEEMKENNQILRDLLTTNKEIVTLLKAGKKLFSIFSNILKNKKFRFSSYLFSVFHDLQLHGMRMLHPKALSYLKGFQYMDMITLYYG